MADLGLKKGIIPGAGSGVAVGPVGFAAAASPAAGAVAAAGSDVLVAFLFFLRLKKRLKPFFTCASASGAGEC